MRQALLIAIAFVLVGIQPADSQVRNTYQITSYPTRALAVTPSNSVEFAEPSTIYVGGDGDVVVRPENSSANVTFVGLVAGSTVPVLVRMVYATGTTATNLVRVY